MSLSEPHDDRADYDDMICRSCGAMIGTAHNYGCEIMNHRLPGPVETHYADRPGRETEDQLARLCQRQMTKIEEQHGEIWALRVEREACLAALSRIVRESPCTLKMGCAECTARTAIRDAGGKI